MGGLDAESETLIPVNRCDFDVARAVKAAPKGHRDDPSSDNFVIAFSAKDHGADAQENLSPTMRAGGHADSHANAGVMPAIAYRTTGNDGVYETGDAVGALTTSSDPNAQVVAYAIQERAICENPDAGPDGAGIREDLSYTLEARQTPQAVAYNITPSQSNKDFNARPASYSQALTGSGNRVSARGGDVIAEPYTLAIRGRSDGHRLEYRQDGTANALLTPNGGRAGMGVGAIATRWAVRRLTPNECEALQGFPKDYTLVPVGKRMSADGPRYKQLGNSKAVNVVRWIGQRIQAVEDFYAALEAEEAA